MSKGQRMVNCTYRGWIRMGLSRTRCPECGAVVQTTNARSSHYMEVVEIKLSANPKARS